jgi:hypothetical protein
MSNCLFAWPDRVLPSATYAPTFSGGAWSAALPLTNLSDANLGSVARSSNATVGSTTFDIDLKATREIRLFAIPDHNFSFAATIRVQMDTEATFALPYTDSGTLAVWPRYYPAGVLPATHESYADGKLTVEAASGLRSGWWFALPAAVQGRYIRVTITDTGNSAGYVQLNRFICAPAWQPAINMSFGGSLAWVADTDSSKTLGGATYFDRRTPRRSLQVNLEALTPEQAMTWAFELQRILGIDGELFFVYDPADTDLLMKQRSFLANLRQLSAIEYPYFNSHKTAFELLEVI